MSNTFVTVFVHLC